MSLLQEMSSCLWTEDRRLGLPPRMSASFLSHICARPKRLSDSWSKTGSRELWRTSDDHLCDRLYFWPYSSGPPNFETLQINVYEGWTDFCNVNLDAVVFKLWNVPFLALEGPKWRPENLQPSSMNKNALLYHWIEIRSEPTTFGSRSKSQKKRSQK